MTPSIQAFFHPSTQPSASDPVLAATDVASTVYDDHTPSMNIDIPPATISDQMFDMIIEGTPETSFISDYMEKHRRGITGVKENRDDVGSKEDTTLEKSGDDRHNTAKDVEGESVPHDEKDDEIQDHSKLKFEESSNSYVPPSQKLESSTTLSTNSSLLAREISIDSLALCEGNREYDNLFQGYDTGEIYPPVPEISTVADLTPSTATSSSSVEASHEVSVRIY